MNYALREVLKECFPEAREAHLELFEMFRPALQEKLDALLADYLLPMGLSFSRQETMSVNRHEEDDITEDLSSDVAVDLVDPMTGIHLVVTGYVNSEVINDHLVLSTKVGLYLAQVVATPEGTTQSYALAHMGSYAFEGKPRHGDAKQTLEDVKRYDLAALCESLCSAMTP